MRLVKSHAVRHSRSFSPHAGYTYNDYLAIKFDIKLSKTERKRFLSKLKQAFKAEPLRTTARAAADDWRRPPPFDTTPKTDKVWNYLKDTIDDFLSERAWGQKYLLRGMTSTIDLEGELIVYELANDIVSDSTVVIYILDEKRKENWYPDSLR